MLILLAILFLRQTNSKPIKLRNHYMESEIMFQFWKITLFNSSPVQYNRKPVLFTIVLQVLVFLREQSNVRGSIRTFDTWCLQSDMHIDALSFAQYELSS
jgi:hypothetical protein